MNKPITAPAQLGEIIRKARKAQRLRQDDLAGTAGVSHVFVMDVERGKPTVQLGKVLNLLRELGIHLFADVPESAPTQPATKRSPKPHG
jgi:y4mF family transcriptional regulator